MIFEASRFKFDFSEYTRPLIMGILNVTPDSFSDANLFFSPDKAVFRAIEMESEGAHIIDIGAESTRPGALSVSADEEIGRLIPVVEKLIGKLSIPISIDTSKASVADKLLEMGASIVNDVSGLKRDPLMAEVVKKHNAGVILMHMRGQPNNMQEMSNYNNLISDLIFEIKESIHIAKKMGIDSNSTVIDPGIGFAKNVEQNIEIIRELNSFTVLNRPILLGASRKSLIGRILNSNVDERLAGSLAVATLSYLNGANILRVHDVKETVDFFKMFDALARE